MVCTSASFCAGRGAGDHAYVFDGSGWSASAQLPTLTPGETDIACSVSSCLVASTNGTWWRYHGTAWTSGTDGPRPPPGYRGSIDVSCGTATFCVAGLGLTDDEEDKYSELYQFDGASWSTPTRYNNYPDRGTTVSCSSATYCFAETMGGDREWNGTRWTTVTTSPEWHLDSVRCFAADACLGEGRPHLSDVNDYVMRFDGTRWTAAAVIPNNVATPNALPPALDCWSMTTCRSLTSIDYTRLWRASSGFGPAREIWNRLYAGVDVSCAAGPFCVAASPRGNMGVWDGGAWRAVVRINWAAAPTAVSCTAAGTCVVVDDGGYAITTTREGDVVSSRRIDTRALSDISCASPDFCVATDSAGRVVRFEGGSWHTPTQHSPDGRLHNVSCPSAAFCMAVGHGYAVRYQGHGRWTRAEKIATYTHTVTCTSASFCMVGTRNLIRIWGGAAFSPAFSIGFSQITTISCPAETYCLVASDDATYQGFTDYKALDSTASSLPAYLVYSHAMSCWAPRQCFLFGDGDRGEITQ